MSGREPFGGRYYGIWNVEGNGRPLALFVSRESADAELKRRQDLSVDDNDRLTEYHQVFPCDVLAQLVELRERATELGIASVAILFELARADLAAGLGVKPGTVRLLNQAHHGHEAEMLLRLRYVTGHTGDDSGAVKEATMLNEMAKRIYDFNVTMGWHQDAPDLAKYLMNLHAEISELWEAWRKGELDEPCNKAQKMESLGEYPLTCVEEELADILIRTLDTAEAYGVDIDRAVKTKMAYNATRGYRWGGKQA